MIFPSFPIKLTQTLDLCRYSKYLEFPELTAAQVRDIDSKLENMLLKLDEFNAVFERVRRFLHFQKYFCTRSDT